MTDFKKGDLVEFIGRSKSECSGLGIVTTINSAQPRFPISVCFQNGVRRKFSVSGAGVRKVSR